MCAVDPRPWVAMHGMFIGTQSGRVVGELVWVGLHTLLAEMSLARSIIGWQDQDLISIKSGVRPDEDYIMRPSAAFDSSLLHLIIVYDS
jgi:hypothetical protein